MHTACVGNFGCKFASHAKTNVIFWQENMTTCTIIFGLMVANPEDFGRGKPCECGIRGNLNQSLRANSISNFSALILSTLVTPNNCRTNDFIFFVEHNKPVHLPRKPDTFDVFSVHSRIIDDASNGFSDCLEPILGILFSPTVLRLIQRIFLRSRPNYLTRLIKQHSFSCRSTNINPD